MAHALSYRFGRLVKNVGETTLPGHLCADCQNVDINKPGEASRRNGFIHALDSAMTGEISLIRKFTDYDGVECYIVIDEAGIRRET